MSEYAKNIQAIEDMWKKRIELRDGGGRMSEYVFRDAPGYGCDMSDMMDGGRVTVGDYFASESTDHYGTLHEPIVRCRDCVYRGWSAGGHFCARGIGITVTPDGFCAWAERREP